MSLNQLPDEIVRHVLFSLPPLDILHGVALTNHRLAHLSNEGLLWRVHCIQSFKYWHPSHGFKTLLRLPARQTNWKKLFLLRYTRNRQISHLFENLLKTKVCRLKRIEKISQFGYDAKDFLIEHTNADDSLEDVLARRYYAQKILDSIHRRLAVEQWVALSNAPNMHHPLGLEKALGAFDMFVLHNQPGDLDDISALLGNITARFVSSHPQFEQLTTREKALALNTWIRAENLTGLQDPEQGYRNLRNCLIGQALRSPDHESIPIISSAIYCCMAERIGLDAKCNAFPSHVHVVISPPSGRDLDNKPIVDTTKRPALMYLDPYGSDDEIPASELKGLLARFGWESHKEVLWPVSTASVVARTSSNIRLSFGTFLEQQGRADTAGIARLTRLLHGPGIVNINAGFYSSLWATLLLTPTAGFDWEEFFDRFMDRFARNWPEDVWLVEKYLMPLYQNFASERQRFVRPGSNEINDAWRVVRYTRMSDDLPPTVFRRSDVALISGVPFKIGQVFRHRRYGWVGVITGWTDKDTRLLSTESVLPGGLGDQDGFERDDSNLLRYSDKIFFTYIRPTTNDRYVIAEINVEPVQDPEVVYAAPFIYAGKYFKRFDPETCCFISNIREEYPED